MTFLEEFMPVLFLSCLLFFVFLPESVHVELPNEGGVVAVVEIKRENLVAEVIYVKNQESVSVLAPPDYILVFVVLWSFNSLH